ncbi:hypothetical protein ALC57_04763 [Trachymyrmex cornetzi]|uniref:Uncharacterized protein n=1 Tax=Trachymyrmex cornetzi TaxID=471704 RepID=A0A195ECN0_9HYME|nr:hypothetical protein ALC57_04763 [Trachymyrmex cornetzi]
MIDDHIGWVESTQTEIINDDKSDRETHDNIQNIVKATISSAKNQCNDDINEFAKDAIKNEYYEFVEAKHAVKQYKYCTKHLKHIVDRNFVKPKDYDKWTDKEQYEHMLDNIKTYVPNVPDSLLFLMPAAGRRGDCGNSTDKPFWLDMEKFQRDGLKPLIFTQKSHTPYLAFKRYLSSICRGRIWMTGNPWIKGTQAYNSIQTVRKIHRAARLKFCEQDTEEFDRASEIQNPWCPSRKTILKDLSSLVVENDFLHLAPTFTGLNQADMAMTQFAFMGTVLLYPHQFGIYASDEDMEAFCHTWKGIGYLLGMEDQYNFCRGSLKEIKQRSHDLVETWLKFYLRDVTPEWEHMLRCITESTSYLHDYLNNLTFEMLLLFITDLLNIDMPCLRSTLTYFQRFNLMVLRFILRYAMKLGFVREFLNKIFHKTLDKAVKYGPEKHETLKKRSEKVLNESW